MYDAVEVSRLLDILGNRNRRRIIDLLRQKPCFVTEISETLMLSPKAVIDHLQMMEREAILSCQMDDRRRKYYYLENDILIDINLKEARALTEVIDDDDTRNSHLRNSVIMLGRMIKAHDMMLSNLEQVNHDIEARPDRVAALNFARAAAAAGVERIVYLGGLIPEGADSEHLRSRAESGDMQRSTRIPVTEVRAGIIVGAGSAAYEVMRDLVYHLPVMVTPKWVQSKSAPIALGNLLTYLLRVADEPAAAGRVFDAGGPEYLTYEAMMRAFGEVIGKRPASCASRCSAQGSLHTGLGW